MLTRQIALISNQSSLDDVTASGNFLATNQFCTTNNSTAMPIACKAPPQ